MRVVCFDLDDTLYKEIDYLHAAFRMIACEVFAGEWLSHYRQMLAWREAGEDVLQRVADLAPGVEKAGLLSMYRYGVHQLTLPPESAQTLAGLQSAGIMLGLITDGRTITQTNKIKALGLERFFAPEQIVISESFGSEKPCERNYRYFIERFPDCRDFTYVGDNPVKDFLAPNVLGWTTLCLRDDGRNIHRQSLEQLPIEARPQQMMGSLTELLTRMVTE